jgi:hypothetical protein
MMLEHLLVHLLQQPELLEFPPLGQRVAVQEFACPVRKASLIRNGQLESLRLNRYRQLLKCHSCFEEQLGDNRHDFQPLLILIF